VRLSGCTLSGLSPAMCIPWPAVFSFVMTHKDQTEAHQIKVVNRLPPPSSLRRQRGPGLHAGRDRSR
jgi:hypothetical protein